MRLFDKPVNGLATAGFQIIVSSMTLIYLLLTSGDAFGQSVREETRLLDKPSGEPRGGKIMPGTAVRLIERQGFWIHVEVSAQRGWLRASQIRFSSDQTGSITLDSGRMGSGNIVSTSAARGLSAKDLLNGKPNFNDVGRLEAIQVDSKNVQAFALAGNLRPPASSIKLNTPAQSSGRGAASGNAGSAEPASSGTGKKKNDEDW